MRSSKRALSAQRHRHRRAGAARVKGSSTRWMVLSRKVAVSSGERKTLINQTYICYAISQTELIADVVNGLLQPPLMNRYHFFELILFSKNPVNFFFASEILQLTQMCRFTSWVKIDLCIGYKMCLEMFQNIPCTFFHTALKKSAIFGEYWLLKISFCFHWNQPSSWSDLSHNL